MRFWTLSAIAVALAGVALTLALLHPPSRLTLAAGPEHGAYERIARQYRDILARDGITVNVVTTAGSAENAELIESGKVDAAILQGGVAVDPTNIEAIGTVFHEPVVFLARQDVVIQGNPAQWSGLRISSGGTGSGTAAAFRDFQVAVGLDVDANTHLSLPYEEAVAELAADRLDMAVFVAPIDAPYLVSAYSEPHIRLLALDYTQAISRRLEYASTVVVPSGAISLDPVMPPSPRRLLALQARLAIGDDMHPALVNRLTMAAKELHGAQDIITAPGEFPSVNGAAISINNAARQLILQGPTTFHDWLPYWMAAQVNRMLLLVLPFLFIVLPIIRAIPGLYAFLMRWKVWQYYPEIRLIEDELNNMDDSGDLKSIDARLAELDDRLSHIKVPAAYRQTAYNARIHIDLVRKRIANRQAGAEPT